jgi:uncharacterized protein (DUF1697 family)
MSFYIAFLRAINVGGHFVKMDALQEVFNSLGLKNVSTYIQSGNVRFETASKSKEALTLQIEKSLQQALGFEVATFLRTKEEMQALVKLDPFKKCQPDAKTYVTFFAEAPKIKAPLFSPKKEVEVIGVKGCDVFCVSHTINGKSGFPNIFLEKELGIFGTTRNWNTTSKMAE